MQACVTLILYCFFVTIGHLQFVACPGRHICEYLCWKASFDLFESLVTGEKRVAFYGIQTAPEGISVYSLTSSRMLCLSQRRNPAAFHS